jgi:hypothetical protein
MSIEQAQPACRAGVTATDLAQEADRAVLLWCNIGGATSRCAAQAIYPIADAALALMPPVQAFLEGRDDAAAHTALLDAHACGAETFL